VWWPNEGYLWAETGYVQLPIAATREIALSYLNRYNDGEFSCANCVKWYPKPAALSRFAGRYCEECAEIYKHNHSRICLLCGCPQWDCYC